MYRNSKALLGFLALTLLPISAFADAETVLECQVQGTTWNASSKEFSNAKETLTLNIKKYSAYKGEPEEEYFLSENPTFPIQMSRYPTLKNPPPNHGSIYTSYKDVTNPNTYDFSYVETHQELLPIRYDKVRHTNALKLDRRTGEIKASNEEHYIGQKIIDGQDKSWQFYGKCVKAPNKPQF